MTKSKYDIVREAMQEAWQGCYNPANLEQALTILKEFKEGVPDGLEQSLVGTGPSVRIFNAASHLNNFFKEQE
jgi:hypothetical protein